MGVNPKIGGFYTPQNGWFISWENPMNKFMIWGVYAHPYFWFNTQFLEIDRRFNFAHPGPM